MKLKPEQLSAALQKAVAPVYFLCGDEPLQLMEAADEIRQKLKQAGFLTREVINIEKGDEWHELRAAAQALSIFADKKLIDLKLPSAKPGLEGSKVLTAYCQHLPADTVLMITAGKLESSANNALWYKALDSVGVIVQVWPLQGAELLHWLQRRVERKGMQIEADALKHLAARIEGNLLAAVQEIEKLYILHGHSRISYAMVEDEVADSSRFDVFQLVDSLLGGKLNRAVKILHGLQDEGIAAPIVLWAISRETRLLYALQTALKQGNQQDAVFKQYQIWDKRKPVMQAALARLKPKDLLNIMQLSAKTDQQIKGQAAGDGWDSLFAICLLFVKVDV